MNEGRLLGADFVRAMACLMVLAHHFIQRMYPSAAPPGTLKVFQFGLTGAYGVAVFFVLSGFLLARPFWQALDAGREMPSIRTYAIRRAARIIPGFWLALTVSFVLSFTVLGLTLEQGIISRFIAGLLLVSDWHYVTFFPVEYNGPLWSIGFEVSSYVFLPFCLLALFLVKPGAWLARLVWIGIICALLALHWAIVAWWPIDDEFRGWQYGLVGGAKYWMPRFNPVGFFVIFAIGALAAGVQVRWAKWKNWLFDGLGLIGLAVAVYMMTRTMGNPENEGYGLFGVPYGFPVFPLAVALALAALPSSAVLGRILDNPPIVFVAKVSFGIYVWHFVVIEVVRDTWLPQFFHAGVRDFQLWLIGCGIVTAITLAIATASFHLLEQPAIRWARRLERRPNSAPTLSPAAG